MTTEVPAEYGFTAERYLSLVDEGLIYEDEKVELLDGLIVAMSPQQPLHATGIRWVERALRRALGPDIVISCQLPLVCGRRSVPEPDFTVLPGRLEDYRTRHPDRALLVIEVALFTVAPDRLTKSRIYAAAGVPDYWIVNLRDSVVEWFSQPDAATRNYLSKGKAADATVLPLSAFPDVAIRAGELLPPDYGPGRAGTE